MTRVFRHPLAAHPVVGPLLDLLDPRASREVRAAPGLDLELRIARHHALQRFLRWASRHVLPGDVAVREDAMLGREHLELPAHAERAPTGALHSSSSCETHASG